MCGIVGYISKSSKFLSSVECVRKMTNTIIHRGPDATGEWVNSKVALGHRRLSIIDLDEKSNQPMLSHDGRYVIVFNGEIYNYKELKEELLREGCHFRTNSDTEVILESYRRYGIECLNKFNGMWAFVIYDTLDNRIILSRDRFGVKPLYILENKDVLIFASEIKAILSVLPEERLLNSTWIYRYIAGTLNEDVDEECIFKNVKIFPSSHYMIYNLNNNNKETHCYWKVNEKEFYDKWIRGKNPLEIFKRLFDDAVGLRLRADVEVGACLSGGIDSSSIVGCVSKRYKKQIHTFSSVYADHDCDEEYYINKVNEKWDTISHYIKPDDYENDFIGYIKKITYHHDQPVGGASLYSQYMVMKSASGIVKVLLDGQGADELFAGYIPYYTYYITDLIEKGTIWAKLKAIALLTILKKEWPNNIGMVSTDTIVRLVGIKNSFLFQSANKIHEMRIKRRLQMFSKRFNDSVNDKYQNRDVKCTSKLNTRLCNDLISKSIPAILHNEDGNSMAFSIESRMPFLDYRIVEFAIALDGKYKIKNQWTKWIIRKACKEYLPREVANRKDKMGFPAPFSRWLRDGKSKDEIRKIIFQFGDRDIVPRETIKYYYLAHLSGEGDFSGLLFRFFNLELWFQIMVDKKGVA